MELYPAEIESLETLIKDWVSHREYELEASFGVGGEVDATTFLNVAQRLKAKGYVELPQEDYMNILTPDNVRFTLTSMRAIQDYCRENTLEGKPFSAMIKDRTVKMSNLDIDDYDTRIKTRRENLLNLSSAVVQEQLGKWQAQKKAFRLIRRWTFQDTANGIRVDMSIVRSTPKVMITKKNGSKVGGDFRWQLSFLERDITKEIPKYEIEVELLREGMPQDLEESMRLAKRNLVRGIGEILRGIQKHSLLIRKSMKSKVLAAYAKLTGTELFRGVAPITLVHQNMTVKQEKGFPNIRTGYNVTDKADGLRVHSFTSESGELYMIDMSMNVYRTGLRNAAAKNALMDGEWVTRDVEGRAIQHLLLFDAYIYKGEDISQLPFAGDDAEKKEKSRYGALSAWVETWNEGDGPKVSTVGVSEGTRLLVSAKVYRFAVPGDLSIFRESKTVLSTRREYYTDGLIFTPNKTPIPTRPGGKWDAQLKWKPSHDSSVDFLVRFDKDEETGGDKVHWAVKEEGKDRIQYKSMRLYVGSDKDITSEDPRGVVLFDQPYAEGAVARRGRGRFEYRPVLFNPQEYPDTMANRCYVAVELDPLTGEEYIKCERSGDPIQDNSIVEMMYEPANEPGWRWVPIRVRYDKTERLQRGEIGRTMNKDDAAENVWVSIHKPVTEGMITTGREQPLPSEVSGGLPATEVGVKEGLAAEVSEVSKVYYARKATVNDIKLIEGLRDFHNEWVKEKILLGSTLGGGAASGGKTLVDLACGQGGDIFKWVRQEPRFCLGIDVAGYGITDPQQGAYARYLKGWKRNGRENMPKMVFVIGSSARSLITGDAGATPEESDILRSVFGQLAPQATVPPYVERECAGVLRPGADVVACMFAFHYFFESKESLQGVLDNIRDTVKVGGYFIGCCFDGKRIFEALRGIPEGGSLVGMEKSAELWKITKRYSETDLINGPESLGLGIDVQFISIGTENREYLVNFDYVVERMREIGLDLLNSDECREMGLKNSSALFEESYEMARASKQVYPMSAPIKQYSFFNRWFIFKRRRGDVEVAAEEAVAGTAAAAATVAETGEVSGGPTDVEAAEAAGEAPQYANTTPPEVAEAHYRERLEEIEKEAKETGKPMPPEARILSAYLKNADARRAVALAAAAPPAPSATAPSVAKAADIARTLPTEAPAVGKRAYAIAELYQFYYDTAPGDRLNIKDPTAARWLDPSAPSEIIDKRTGTKYPSMEHFMAAMKYQLASNKPELGANLFSSSTGTVHRKFRELRAAESGATKRVIPAARDQELLKQERAKVLDESKPTAFKRYTALFDDALWNSVKDEVIEEALQYRWEHDARFRKIVEAVRDRGLILLYYTGNISGSNLGGVRRAPEGFIDGENKVGRILMRIAGFSGV